MTFDEFSPGLNGGNDIVLSGPAFGVFSHKLIPHPTRTQVWQWSEDMGRFIKIEENISDPETRRQQVNVAEAFLRAGDYEKAVIEYRKAIEDDTLAGESRYYGSEPDWIAFSRLRLGQIYALLGQEIDARAALEPALVVCHHIGQLVGIFYEQYQGGDTVVTAWVEMMNKTDLYRSLYEDKAGDLGFPMDAFDIYYPGLAVAAYLDRHPEATDYASDELLAALTTLGLDVKTVLIADLNGDGKPEVAFITPDPDLEHVWLAYEKNGRWQVRVLAEADELSLQGIIPLTDCGAIVVVRLPENVTPQTVGFSLDKDDIVTYDMQGETPQVLPSAPWPTIGSN